LKATGGRLIHGGHERIFRGISTDSRTLTNDNLFIPIAGDKFDGHDFTGSALKNGAAGLLVQAGKEEKLKNVPENVSVVLVNDTVKALGDIAHFWRKRFDIPVIAVTGSSGKTTTKEMIASIAGLSKNVLRNYGNFNNFIGLPLTLLKKREVVNLSQLSLPYPTFCEGFPGNCHIIKGNSRLAYDLTAFMPLSCNKNDI